MARTPEPLKPHEFVYFCTHSENPDSKCPYCQEKLSLDQIRFYWEDPEWYDFWMVCNPCFLEQDLKTRDEQRESKD